MLPTGAAGRFAGGQNEQTQDGEPGGRSDHPPTVGVRRLGVLGGAAGDGGPDHDGPLMGTRRPTSTLGGATWACGSMSG